MKKAFLIVGISIFLASNCFASKRTIESAVNTDLYVNAKVVSASDVVRFQCEAVGRKWKLPIKSAKIVIRNESNKIVVKQDNMQIYGSFVSYDYIIPTSGSEGNWKYKCIIKDKQGVVKRKTAKFSVSDAADIAQSKEDALLAHNNINEYNGPSTCISCHRGKDKEVLRTLHMKWSGPTPELVNTNGKKLGKAVAGINTFCTYAMTSRGACFSCHVRADGNAPHPPQKNDVDCLMCHSDTYQRKFVVDPTNTETVTNILGEEKTYVFGAVDAKGNYTTVPDFDKMPPGTTMVDVVRAVHLPTSKSCLRCHATAGGGDWIKRGDMGLSTADPMVNEDVHLSKSGANLACVNCHSGLDHKMGGRGIDLRQTEAITPTCQACHTTSPHVNETLNRHAQGQVSCQVCHIKAFAKGGATEMARDWRIPVWNPAFCSGQGGFVGEELKASNVQPEYVWFDGTSYVYNLGEKISPEPNGVYAMAKASGRPFDGKSSIVPIKRHFTIMPLLDNGKIVPPAIMWMFMTGDFHLAVEKGMKEHGMSGTYSIVEADAEMLITHGVEPKAMAPACSECHDSSGSTPDGTRMLPFTALGYHDVAQEILSCTLCHSQKNLSWEDMHGTHRDEVSCSSCHTQPTGLKKAKRTLCSSCHERESWENESHKKHIEKGIKCTRCHTFS